MFRSLTSPASSSALGGWRRRRPISRRPLNHSSSVQPAGTMVFGMLSRSHESACNETARSSHSTGFMHGMLPDHPYVAHAKNLAFALTLLAFADHLIIKPWVAKKVAAKDLGTTRWFFIHSLANAFVCLSGLKSMKAVALDPLRAFDGAAFSEDETGFFGAISVWPLTIINAVHIYHMIGGFRLTPADYFHHGLFIPTIALPGQVYRWGPPLQLSSVLHLGPAGRHRLLAARAAEGGHAQPYD